MEIQRTQAKELWNQVRSSLQPLYGQDEAEAIAFRLMEDLLGINKAAVLANQLLQLPFPNVLQEALEKMKNGTPVQYVIGHTWFAGLKIQVNPSVLIPRPETEELYQMVADQYSKPEKIVDWCTGSGCLALALKNTFPYSEVYGLDLSSEAITTARKNADLLGILPIWIQADIFEPWPKDLKNSDILISNPPYVQASEAKTLSLHVIEHEPHLALFVPDRSPLIFYERLLRQGLDYLIPGGKLYCEINALFAKDLRHQAVSMGWESVDIHPDMNGRDRFLTAQSPN